VKIPALDLEIPAQTQKGSINTIEGFILKTIEGIEDLQEERRKYDPITAKKIDDFIALLKEYREGKKYPFEFILEDPSGNSFIQNPWAPSTDSYCKKEEFQRSIEHYTFMGFNQ
jgi:zinc finger protein